SSVGDYKYTSIYRNGFQRIHPRLLLTLPHSRRWTATMNELGECQEGIFPGPSLMMTDLFNYLWRNIAERFELFINGEPHSDGCFQRAWAAACKYEVERSYMIANLARQSDAFCGEM